MLKIFKDKEILTVTRGAYEDLYKPLGYDIVSDKKEIKPEIVKNDIEIKNEDKTNEDKGIKVDEEIKTNLKRK